MEKPFVFYIYQNQIELRGKLFSAGELSLEILNISAEQFQPLGALADEMKELWLKCRENMNPALLWELNEKCRDVNRALRKFRVFENLLPWDDEVLDQIAMDVGQSVLYAQEQNQDGDQLTLMQIAGDYQDWLWDIAAFNTVIHFYIDLTRKNTHCDPETNAATLHFLYNNERLFEKVIWPTMLRRAHPYTFNDNDYTVAYIPREKPDGSFAICQRMETNSLQAVLKADYFLALNAGYNIRRCIICGRYFLLKSAAHALYCEGACPHAPRFTCRQFGTHEVQKELAKDVPKLKVKERAFARITKDKKRENISREEARIAKDYVRDRLYDSLRSSECSVEDFENQVSSERVYRMCGIKRTARERGRPRKQHE